MLPFFPQAYPDELLYSLCARYSDYVQYPDKRMVIQELLKNPNALAIVDLPSHLNNLIAKLPYGHQYTFSELIDKHTLLPYYKPFHPPERVERLCQDMQDDKQIFVSGRLGIMANTVPNPDFLRFCPMCAGEDRKEFGEPYWHRLHQVSGVQVCPTHAVFLEDSQGLIRQRKTRYEFISARCSIETKIPRFLDLAKPIHQALLKIATDSYWLLNQQNLLPGLQSFHIRYSYLLADFNLATYNGRVYINRLYDAFRLCFPPELLSLLHCDINYKSQHNWLLRLVRSPKTTQHPLHHLLLIHFLGHTAESFFQLPSAFKPFGDGNWPCLNPVCKQFKKKSLKKYHLSFSKQTGRPIGTFSCGCCDFSYSRVGPDHSQEDKYRYSRVESYGETWELTLKDLWTNLNISLREIARRLDIDTNTVNFHASRLKLPCPRQNPTEVNSIELNLSVEQSSKPSLPQQLEMNRSTWLSLIQDNPNCGVNALRRLMPRVYTWLYRHDKEWLQVNLPSRQATVIPPRVDWHSRDLQLAQKVKTTTQQLKQLEGKPVQITVAAIGREIGELSRIQKKLDKLPLTAQVLAGVVETREEYAVRRIDYAVQCYYREQLCPQQWQLIRRAGLRPEMTEKSEVRKALEEAMNFLGNLLDASQVRM